MIEIRLKAGKIETMDGRKVIAPPIVQTFLASIGEGAMCKVHDNDITVIEDDR